VTSEDPLVQPSARKGSLDEIIEHPVQLYPENLQRWGIYHIPREAVPVNDCSYSKKFFSYVEIKCIPVQPVLVPHCLLHMAPQGEPPPSS